MVNANMLRGKIVENGKTLESFSAELSITSKTLRAKMKNNSFTVTEVEKIADILGLSKKDAINIFFN